MLCIFLALVTGQALRRAGRFQGVLSLQVRVSAGQGGGFRSGAVCREAGGAADLPLLCLRRFFFFLFLPFPSPSAAACLAAVFLRLRVCPALHNISLFPVTFYP